MTVKVTCSELPGSTRIARLADVSAHGLSLILNDEVQVGSSLKVNWGEYTFIGKSVYCNPCGQEFLVGLKVEDPVYKKTKKCTTQ